MNTTIVLFVPQLYLSLGQTSMIGLPIPLFSPLPHILLPQKIYRMLIQSVGAYSGCFYARQVS